MWNPSALRQLVWTLVISVLVAAGGLVFLLLPSTSRLVAVATHEITISVAPEVREWSFHLRNATDCDAQEVMHQLSKRGLVATDDPRPHRVELIRLERESLTTYCVTLGGYPPAWAGLEAEYRFSFRGRWRLTGRTIIRQA